MTRLPHRRLRVVSAIKEICAAGLDSATLRERVNARLVEALDADAAVFLEIDPGSTLPVASESTGWVLPDSCAMFREHAYLAGPIADFGRRAHAARPVATLQQLLGQGDPRDPYVDVLDSYGFSEDLQAMLSWQRRPLGWIGISRRSKRYDDDDVRLLETVVPYLVAGLRAATTSSALAASPGRTLGMVVLGTGGAIEVVNAAAERLLRVSAAPGSLGMWYAVQTVAALLKRALEQGDDLATLPSAAVIVDGERYTVRGEPGSSTDGYARGIVFIEPPNSADYNRIFESFGLTPREVEIALALVRGATNVQIAGELALSQHTVKTHTRAVFEKTGVASRRELAAQMAGAALH